MAAVCTFILKWSLKNKSSTSLQNRATQDLLTVLYLAAHVDWYAHNDYWDGDACYKGDDHRRAEQHAHLPQNLAGLRPWFLPPECAS